MIRFTDIESSELSKEYGVGIFFQSCETRFDAIFNQLIKDGVCFLRIIIIVEENPLEVKFNTDNLNVNVISYGEKEKVSELLDGFLEEGHSFLVDYSCMGRNVMADIVARFDLFSQINNENVNVDFGYAHAEFSKPLDDYGPVIDNGYINEYFIGDDILSSNPSSCVLGVGYEREIALGVIEDLEPSMLVIFHPTGHDEKYTDEIKNANADLISTVKEANRVYYNIHSPENTYIKLCGTLKGLSATTSPVIITLGPKVFTLAALLCCCAFETQFGIWRIAPKRLESSRDRKFNGQISYNRAEWIIG